MMKKTIATIALGLTLTTGAMATEAKPYATFNPVVMLESLTQQADSALYNYGNQGYDFVVEAIELPGLRAPQQLAALDQ